MANLDAKRGLRPLRNAKGGNTMYVEHWKCAASQIGMFQLVAITAAGLVTAAAANSSAVIGVALNNVAAGVAGAASRVAVVAADPNQLYIIQATAGTITNLAGYRGAFFSLVSNANVATATGQAKGELSDATATSAWAAARQLQAVDLYSGVDNAFGTSAANSSNAQFVVQIPRQTHVYAGNKGI